MGKKINTLIAVEFIENKYPGKFDFSKYVYTKANEKSTLICKDCGLEFETTYNTLKNGKYGCPKCYRDSTKNKNDDFILKVILVHADKYDLSNTIYTTARTKVKVKCNRCGTDFELLPRHLLKGFEHCPNCSVLASLYSNYLIFKNKFDEKFKDKISIISNDFRNYKTKMKFKCIQCGTEFESTPDTILNSIIGCPNCAEISRRLARTKSTEEFIELAIKIHGNKYNYANSIYTGRHNFINIICPTHGEFSLEAGSHLQGHGCPRCGISSRILSKTKSLEDFIKDCIEIHGNRYNYSKIDYINSQTEVCIICPEHGEFWQKPNKHLQGHGCPLCNSSKGESFISNILDKNKISYITLYKLEDNYFSQSKLFIDFRLDIDNVIYFIEYNGKLHYVPIEYFGGQLRFEKQQLRDILLRDYCKLHNIILIEIPYTYNNQEIVEIINNIQNGFYLTDKAK